MNNEYSSVDEPGDIPITGIHETTADQVRARAADPATGHVPGADASEEPKPRGGKYNSQIGSLGFGPVKVPNAIVSFARGKEVPIPAGFYLMSGGTGGGKSITAAGILVTARFQNVPVRYIYCYEARTPDKDDKGKANPFFMGAKADNDVDLAMTAFISKLPAVLTDVVALTSDTKVGIVVVDSIALPMRAYRSRDRQNMATMKEGLQPMDIAFVVAMEEFATKNNLAILGVINDDLVPFAAKLEGMAEGIATVHSPGIFSIRSRFDRRVHECLIEEAALDAAGAFLHYPPYDRAKSTIWGTEGI